jgi:eukaryotic-like serine/threonine-protein kinase
MTGFAQAIHDLQTGVLSSNELLGRIDDLVAGNQGNFAHLMEILQEENTKVPLAPEVFAEVQRRLEQLAGTEPTSSTGSSNTRAARDNATATDRAVVPAPLPDGQSVLGPERTINIGDTLNGRFVLEECLGFGGMGTVFKALDLRKLEASDRNPYIAVKVLNCQFRGHPKSLIALQREAKKAQALAHPNIVTVFDFDREGPIVYLTMEYLSGQPLSRIVRATDFKGMPCTQAMAIVLGAAKALAYAHERGFVHCDFKPANIFLTDAGQVKVIDFGIARVFQRPEAEAEATVFDPGSLGGMTPAYASPEMLEHREPDPRDDIYALACITYELLTGRHPFGRLPAIEARKAGLKPQRPGNLSLRQWRALKNALSFERDSRTLTVEGFVGGFSGKRRAAPTIALWAGSVLVLALAGAAALRHVLELSSENATSAAASVPAAKSVSAPQGPASESVDGVDRKLSQESAMSALAKVPCSALSATVQGNDLKVQGFVSARFGAAGVRKAVDDRFGETKLDADVQEVREDACGVIDAFSSYWKRNRLIEQAASIRTKGANSALKEGDPLVMNITTPAYEAYVNVDYFAFDGTVAHLVPSPRAKANLAPPNHAATIGDLGEWVISKPFGTELLVLLITPQPLFAELRPESESSVDYLQALERQLGQMSAKYGSEKIVADFVQITTSPRSR